MSGRPIKRTLRDRKQREKDDDTEQLQALSQAPVQEEAVALVEQESKLPGEVQRHDGKRDYRPVEQCSGTETGHRGAALGERTKSTRRFVAGDCGALTGCGRQERGTGRPMAAGNLRSSRCVADNETINQPLCQLFHGGKGVTTGV